MVFQWVVRHLRYEEGHKRCEGHDDFCPQPASAALQSMLSSSGVYVGRPTYLCSKHLGERFTAWMSQEAPADPREGP